jgi:hypothetical protein
VGRYRGEEPVREMVDSGYPRLEDQIAWYDAKSEQNQKRYKRPKVVELVCAALVPLAASLPATGAWSVSLAGFPAGILGVAIVVLEGLQHLNQYQHNWVSYRSTCEALKHEKYLYLGRSGLYDATEEETKKLLVERVEALISTEHSKWVSGREQAKKARPEEAATH